MPAYKMKISVIRNKSTAMNSQVVERILIGLSIVFLYTPIYSIGDYSVTIGTVVAVIFVVFTILRSVRGYVFVWQCSIFIIGPLVLYAIHVWSGSRYAIDLSRFLLSYSLWCVSVVVIWSAFQRRAFFSGAWIYRIYIGLSILGAFQYLGASFFGIWWAYDLVAPLIGFDIYNSYLTLGVSEGIRAIGTYYEPSMFGRVIATLFSICVIKGNKPGPLIALLVLNIITTRSLGLIALAGSTIMLYGAASFRQLVVVGAGILAGYLFFGEFINSRLENTGDIDRNSTYIRMVIPFDAIKQVLPNYPFGVPIGANALVVQNTLVGRYSNLAEVKITNGVYEFILYFGVISIIILIGILLYIFYSAIKGRRAEATIALYLLLSTAASSSYLSIESSFLNYILISGVRSSCVNTSGVRVKTHR